MPLNTSQRKAAVANRSDNGDLSDQHKEDTDEEPVVSTRFKARKSRPTMSHDSTDEASRPAQRGSGKLKPVRKNKAEPPYSIPDTSSQKSPAKSRDTLKTGSKPIYSFFNAVTQTQLSSQLSASPEKNPSTPRIDVDEPEGIDSDHDVASSLHTSKGSKTALTVRKRKVQQTTSFQGDASLPPPVTQKFRKTGENSRTPSFSTAAVQDTRPWTERFAPVDLSELAVHKRKVGDVRGWLESTLNGRRQKVLVLKGGAGTGKTMTVSLLAKELGLDVVEWKNPDVVGDGSGSVSAEFEEFIGRAGRYGGLLFAPTTSKTASAIASPLVQDEDVVNAKNQILLVEEFPTSLSRTSTSLQSFRSTILQYVSSSALPLHKAPTPVVMVISETLLSANTAAADSFTAHRLMGPELSNHPYINIFEFNPIAPTFLTKALELMVLKEARKSGRRQTPGPEVLKHLTETGDIRSAASSLEFMCLRGDESGDLWSSKVPLTKTKRKAQSVMTKGEEEVLRLITNRESSLGIFHAVGRVCYNNRIEPPSSADVTHPPTWLPPTLRRPKVPERDVDELINELGTDVSTFVAALHENYALSCHTTSAELTLDAVCGSIHNLSDADLLSVDRFSGSRPFSGSPTESLQQDEMAFQVTVRGVLFNLPHPVHRSMGGEGRRGDSHKMFYPASLKMWRKQQEIEDVVEVLMADAQNCRQGITSLEPRRKNNANESHAEGVHMWARNNVFSTQSSTPKTAADEQASTTYTAVVKAELLLERLPYAAQILQARCAEDGRLRLILDVTQFNGQAPEHHGDGDDDEDDGGGPESVDTGPQNKRPTRLSKKEPEDTRLGTSVDTSLDSLILEEDDIED